MLTKEFIAQMKAKLLEMKTTLEADLTAVAEKDPKHPQNFNAVYPESASNSEDDNAEEISTFADEMSLVNELESQLKDVIKSLESIEKGSYGMCKYCGNEIDQKRLEARPHSSSCVSCKKTLTQEL